MPDGLRASVVIPVHNNRTVLQQTLAALAGQTLSAGAFEVIVVDDGSTDGTAATLAGLSVPYALRVFSTVNGGAAAARNFGAAQARGPVLIFLDSDVTACPSLVAEHLTALSRYDHALVVGPTRLARDCGSLFYRLMGSEVFAMDRGPHDCEIPCHHLLTRNLSLTCSDFETIGGFDRDFPPGSGFEDTEFAYRARKLGYRVIYCSAAAGVHEHVGTLADVSRHVYNYQLSAALLLQKHPTASEQIVHLRDKAPIRWQHDGPVLILRKIARRLLALPPSLWLLERSIPVLEKRWPSPVVLRFLYWQVLGAYLFLGFRAGLRRYGVRQAARYSQAN